MKYARPKPPMGACGVLTFAFNVFVLIFGAIIIACGGYTVHFLRSLEFDKRHITMCWYFVIIGVVVVLVSIMAFVGVCCRYRCFLCLHFLVIGAISIAVVIGGIMVLIYSREVRLNSIVKRIQTSITSIVKAMNEHRVSNIIITNIQSMMGCCGAEGSKDYHDPAEFCCVGSTNCTNYPKKGCKETLGEFWNTYEIPIGVSLIGLGVIMNIPGLMAHRTWKNMGPPQKK